MDITNSVMQKLRLCETAMLKEFISVCNLLDLKYFIIGGTLLGAVRHKGFIPWDDDIDVGMFREDYDKFISVAQDYLPSHYFIQTFSTDPEWPANFAKLRDCRTTFIESSVKNCEINHGIYIDIFPLDYYPEKKSLCKKFDFKNKLFVKRISQVFTLPKENLGIFKMTKKCLTNLATSILYPTVQNALKGREKLFKSVSGGRMIANHCGAWGKKEIIPSEWYGEGTTLEFEGIKVQGPYRYDLWLTQVYGDYMQLPPEDKRVAHHYVEVIDLDKPYTEYKVTKAN